MNTWWWYPEVLLCIPLAIAFAVDWVERRQQ